MTDCFVFENESFTTDELFQQLGFSTYPTDRELEAKLIMHLRKYNQSMEENHQRLFRFFTAVYDFFFEQEEEELEKEDETEKRTTGMDDETVVEGIFMNFSLSLRSMDCYGMPSIRRKSLHGATPCWNEVAHVLQSISA